MKNKRKSVHDIPTKRRQSGFRNKEAEEANKTKETAPVKAAPRTPRKKKVQTKKKKLLL